jgi:hypothetical protein
MRTALALGCKRPPRPARVMAREFAPGCSKLRKKTQLRILHLVIGRERSTQPSFTGSNSVVASWAMAIEKAVRGFLRI